MTTVENPVWSRFAGQGRRQYLRLFVFFPLVALLFAGGALAWAWSQKLQEYPLYMAFLAWLSLYLGGFIVVMFSPLWVFPRLGGAQFLRELQSSTLPNRDVPRLLIWGNFHSWALPACAMVYVGAATVLGMYFIRNGTVVLGESHLAEADWFVWLYVKPPLDHAMNLCIVWHALMKGTSKWRSLFAFFLVFCLAYPAGAGALILYGTPDVFGMTLPAMAALWGVAAVVDASHNRRGIHWAIAAALLVAAGAGAFGYKEVGAYFNESKSQGIMEEQIVAITLLLFAFKAWVAWRLYDSTLDNWTMWTEKRFAAGG